MCFSEFAGYTCGHSSPPVVRPCPLTTTLPETPVCAHHAVRPILSPSMCPSCQRIIHGRAVLIQEWEHRFMHERGACGCPIRFPELLQPRVAGAGTNLARSVGTEDAGTQTEVKAEDAADGKALQTAAAAAAAAADPATYIPPMCQQVPAGVAIRLPSLFAAEWLQEHRRLHAEGRCLCPAVFAVYQPAVADEPLTIADLGLLQDFERGAPGAGAGAGAAPADGAPRPAGAIREADGAPSTSQVFNDACAAGLRQGGVHDWQSAVYHAGYGLPLVGLPIGAGPEGQSHAGDWRDCPLRRLTSYERAVRGVPQQQQQQQQQQAARPAQPYECFVPQYECWAPPYGHAAAAAQYDYAGQGYQSAPQGSVQALA